MSAGCIRIRPEQPTLRGSLGCLLLRSAGTTDVSRISRLFASASGRNSRHFADLSVVCIRVRLEQPTLRGSLGCLHPRSAGTTDTSRFSRLFASAFCRNSRHFTELSAVCVCVRLEQPTLRGSLGCLHLRPAGTADTSRFSRLFASAFDRNSRHFAVLSAVCIRGRPEQPTLRGSLGCLLPRPAGTADASWISRLFASASGQNNRHFAVLSVVCV